MRTLLIDIETSPNKVWSFEMRNAFISWDAVIEPSRMICFAAKWYGEEETFFWSEFHDSREEMLLELHEMLEEADVLLHFNGKRFDEPRINGEFWQANMLPPSPYQRIDLWRTVSKRFDLPSSKLAYVLTAAKLPNKVETGGFSLWKGCMAGDQESWDRMKEYNINDVVVMEALYERLLPWIPEHPNMAVYADEQVCPACGADRLEKRGFSYTGVSKFQRYRCNACGKWSRSGKRISGADIREVAA